MPLSGRVSPDFELSGNILNDRRVVTSQRTNLSVRISVCRVSLSLGE